MKKALGILFAVGLVGAFVYTLTFLYSKSQADPVVYDTLEPTRTDISKKTVATGAIVPRHEVEIKPRVSGIIETIAVQPGDKVKTGDLIAEITIVPDMASLNRAEASVKQTRIGFENAQNELERARKLRGQNIMSETEFNRYQLDYQIKREELQAAQDNLQIIKRGASRKGSQSSNTLVRATVNGMVLDVPIKVGESVIESNTFNAGTTIALIADMTDMIFEGKVDESEVGKIKEGMPLEIKIGALQGDTFAGTLEHIAPKGLMEDGAIQFEIRAALDKHDDTFIRANYSANADIVLDRRKDVLSIPESALEFEDGKPHVWLQTAPNQYERRPVELGLSDGINIEVLSGVTESDRLRGREGGSRKRGR